jgi:hypothetical protein
MVKLAWICLCLFDLLGANRPGRAALVHHGGRAPARSGCGAPTARGLGAALITISAPSFMVAPPSLERAELKKLGQ